MRDPVLSEPFAPLDGERCRMAMAGLLPLNLDWTKGLNIGLAALLFDAGEDRIPQLDRLVTEPLEALQRGDLVEGRNPLDDLPQGPDGSDRP